MIWLLLQESLLFPLFLFLCVLNVCMSSTGNCKLVLIFPFSYPGNLFCVLEVGFREAFSFSWTIIKSFSLFSFFLFFYHLQFWENRVHSSDCGRFFPHALHFPFTFFSFQIYHSPIHKQAESKSATITVHVCGCNVDADRCSDVVTSCVTESIFYHVLTKSIVLKLQFAI